MRLITRRWLAAAGLAVATFGPAAVTQAQALLTSTFTYQGQLKKSGNLVETPSDFRFTLVDAGGAVIAGPIARNGITVKDGVFTVNLDFGFDVFEGNERFLKIEVRNPAGGGAFSTLSPNQPITAAPYALMARRGEVPWVVQEPGSTNSVTLSPDETGFFPGPITTRNGGVLSQTSGGINGRSGGLANFNLDTGAVINFNGADNRDGSGFVTAGVKNGALGDGTVEIDGDIDNDGTNGLFEGGVRLNSVGTGGAGGSLRISRNGIARTTTLEARGGSDTGGAKLSIFDPADGNAAAQLFSTPAGRAGGELQMFRTDDDLRYAAFEPDVAGSGGFLIVDGGSGNFFVDGNAGATNSPAVGINGGASSMSFDTNATGNGSVNLPADAISAAEMLNEPGVANDHAFSAAIPASGVGTLLSRTITVPTSGFVVVLADGDIAINHVTGTASTYRYGVSNVATSLPGDQDESTALPGVLPTGLYDFSASAHGLFSVAAGTHTFFFNADKFSGGGSATVFDLQLTLMFFPTAYGSTNSNFTGGLREDNTNHGPVAAPMSPQQIQAERAQGEAFAQARVMKELADMQAKMDQLRKQVESMNGSQGNVKAPKRAPDPANSNVPALAAPAAPISLNKETK